MIPGVVNDGKNIRSKKNVHVPIMEHTMLSQQGKLTEGERLGTVDLLIKIACFVKKVNNIFVRKSN